MLKEQLCEFPRLCNLQKLMHHYPQRSLRSIYEITITVEGLSITLFCSSHQLSGRSRLSIGVEPTVIDEALESG